jgi:hypothetical protein
MSSFAVQFSNEAPVVHESTSTRSLGGRNEVEGDVDWLLVPEPACDHDTTMDADEGAYEEVLIFSEDTTNLNGAEDKRGSTLCFLSLLYPQTQQLPPVFPSASTSLRYHAFINKAIER